MLEKIVFQRFCDEVTTLWDILISVQNLVEAPDGAKLSFSDSSLKQCRSTFEELIAKLELHQGKKKRLPNSGFELGSGLSAAMTFRMLSQLLTDIKKRSSWR